MSFKRPVTERETKMVVAVAFKMREFTDVCRTCRRPF